MKPILKFTAYILLIGTAGFASCKKEKQSLQKQNPSPVVVQKVKARIEEYGTNLPLSGAAVDAWTTYGNGRVHINTDAHGECSFDGNEIDLGVITKEGYWSVCWNLNFNLQAYRFAPISLFPPNASFDNFTGSIISCDSFVVKLFPKNYITLHLKDSLGLSTCEDCHIIFAVNGLFKQDGVDNVVYNGTTSDQNGEIIRLRPHIDTTFRCAIFGNTNNLFNIGEDDAANGWEGFNNFLHSETIFIPNNSSINLNITY